MAKAKKIVKKAVKPLPIPEVKKIPVNLVEITSIHSELVKVIPGGGTVETRFAIAARLWAVIEGLR